jgi:hypothetical protein
MVGRLMQLAGPIEHSASPTPQMLLQRMTMSEPMNRTALLDRGSSIEFFGALRKPS